MGGAGVGLYTWRIEPHWVELVGLRLPVRGLPVSLQGTTLVQLSDLHIGPQVDSTYLTQTFRRVTALAPDFVVYTGDFITRRSGWQSDELARVLVDAPRGRLGTAGILGNHDYGVAWRQEDVAEEVARRASDTGIHILRNSSVDIEGLRFVGFDDLWGPNFEPTAVPWDATGSRAMVTLCHNPDALDLPIWDGYRGWVLSGHTHGGQCKPPFLPPPLLPVRNRRYTAGAITLEDGRSVYINRGLGYLLQVRFNVRPEVTVFTLVEDGPAAAG